MQFTTLAAIFAAAMAVGAAPLEARALPTGPIPARTVYVYFFKNPTGGQGCSAGFDQVNYLNITEDDTGACHNIVVPAGVNSEDIEANIQRPIRFYNKPCNSLGGSNTYTVGPGFAPNGCTSNKLMSYQFI